MIWGLQTNKKLAVALIASRTAGNRSAIKIISKYNRQKIKLKIHLQIRILFVGNVDESQNRAVGSPDQYAHVFVLAEQTAFRQIPLREMLSASNSPRLESPLKQSR